MNHLLSRKVVNNQQLTNPIRRLPSNGAFFSNANGSSFEFNQGTFTAINGDMITTTIYSAEQPFPWNKYRWVDFDQQTLRYLRISPTGIVTMEMEPMTSTSRLKMCRIHWYRDRDKEDIFYGHLGFVKSHLARRPYISQFFGTSIDNADSGQFIVLSGGGLSLSNVFIGGQEDFQIIKRTCFFQLMDIFSTSPFTVSEWSWSIFWDLPLFSQNCQLLVDVILLESHGLMATGSKMAHRQSSIAYLQARLQDQTSTSDMEMILYHGQDLVRVREAVKRYCRIAIDMFVSGALGSDHVTALAPGCHL